MRSAIIGLMLLVGLGLSACQQMPAEFTSEDVQAIESVMGRQQKAWNSGDLEGFMQGYWKSDSLKFVAKNGVVYGWENMLGNYRKGYPDKQAMGHLRFTLLHIEGLGKGEASVTGKWELTETEKKASGHFLLLFRQVDGKWRITTDCTS